jgi:hypothetical protein
MVFESVEISTPSEESPAVSWPAIAAGAIAAAALTLVLLAFGAGMGFSAVSPWGNSGISASAFQITTGLYLIVVALLASAMGGMSPGGCVQGGSASIPTKSSSARGRSEKCRYCCKTP